MVESSKVSRVKGTTDLLQDAYQQKQELQQKLLSHFQLYGFFPIETPILEHSELYLRKAGEEIVSRMYDFEYQNRRLCLRPELTASTIRAYIESFQDTPLPMRLSYAGSVFRYEKPQYARYRQFTQVGVELIGTRSGANGAKRQHDAASTLGEVEIIAMATSVMGLLKLRNYQLVIGNVEMLETALVQMGLQGQLRNFLMRNMETLRKESWESLLDKTRDLQPDFQYVQEAIAEQHANPQGEGIYNLTDIIRQMSDDNARAAVLDFLSALNIEVASNRNHTDIVDGLIAKIKNENENPKISRALDFMKQLSTLRGAPADVLPEARKLLDTYQVDHTPLLRVEKLLAQLAHLELDPANISLDLGLIRGLQYYTSLVFEIHHDGLGEERQLCGGGRYDDLVQLLGGRGQLDAIGCSFGLERLQLALDLEKQAQQNNFRTNADVVIIPIHESDHRYMHQVASQLRANDISIEYAVRDRNIRNHLDYADRKNIPYVIIVGNEEAAHAMVSLRHMQSGAEQKLSIDQAILDIKRG